MSLHGPKINLLEVASQRWTCRDGYLRTLAVPPCRSVVLQWLIKRSANYSGRAVEDKFTLELNTCYLKDE
jgi:hypothetical protein